MKPKDIRYQYIFGSDIDLKDEAQFRALINTQGIFEDEFEAARYASPCLQLQYEEGLLARIRELDEFDDDDMALPSAARKFRYSGHQKHRINFLIPQEEPAHSYLGGRAEGGFTLPMADWLEAPFQLIGRLSRRDEPFSWLPFESLYLTYPLYTGVIGYLFLDYSDPLRPVAHWPAKEVQYVYGKLPRDGIHEFRYTPLEIRPINVVENKDDLSFEDWYAGVAGVPIWVQYPELPYCPKTGKLMRFVAQVNTTESVVTIASNLSSEAPHFRKYARDLRFWGSGTLYVFLEPESRVVGMLIQDT